MFRVTFRRLILGLTFVVVGLSVAPAVYGNNLSPSTAAAPEPNTKQSERIGLPTPHKTTFRPEYEFRSFVPHREKKRPTFSVGRLEWTLRSAPPPLAWQPRVPGVNYPESPMSMSFDLRWKDR